MAMTTVAMTTVGLLVSSVLGVSPSLKAGFRHSDLNQTIEVEEGNDFTLQGRLEPPVNLSSYTFDVARLNDDVYFRREGKDQLDAQMSRYKNRTNLNHEALSEGTVMLQISSVNLSDSGPYKVYVLDLGASFTTHIIVVPKGQRNKTKRNDTTTTRPPAADPGGENGKEETRSHVIPIVVLFLGAVAVIGIIVGLVKEKCMKKFRERMNRQAEAANGTELSDDLINKKPAAERGGHAADDNGNHEQVV